MSSLKQSIFWVALYLTAVVILAQFDYSDSPIIDFAKYFYFAAIFVLPATIFFPSISKVSVFVPMTIWGFIYLVMLQILDRTASAENSTFAIILLEFFILEAGVWLGYLLAYGISHAESLMDAMALTAFPNRIEDLESARQRIRIEIARSRRYHRQFSLIIVRATMDQHPQVKDWIGAIQHDLRGRFSIARLGQVIDETLRQVDLVFRDRLGRYVILCPEVTPESAELLARRLSRVVEDRIGSQLQWGIAAFPDDALSFDDLFDAARNRMVHFTDAIGQEPIAVSR